MKKLLVIAILCTGCAAKGQVGVAEPPPRLEPTGGVAPETGEDLYYYYNAEIEDECNIEFIQKERGPYQINGNLAAGVLWVNQSGEKLIDVNEDADHIHLYDVKVQSTNVPLGNFVKWAEAYVENDLIAWMDEVPSGAFEVQPEFDGSIDLMNYKQPLQGSGTIRARYPKYDTEVSFKMVFIKFYNCQRNL